MWNLFRTQQARDTLQFSEKIRRILVSISIAAVGIVLLKVIPMAIWGAHIEFDASMHVTTTILGLYILWFFIDQNPKWRAPYIMIATGIVVVVAVQRLLIDAHNEIGIILAIALGLAAILSAEWQDVKEKISF